MMKVLNWKQGIAKRILSVVLMVITLTVVLSTSTTVSYAVTEESIKQKESQISDAKKERDSLKSNLTDLESVKKQLESTKSDLNTYIAQLDSSLTDIQDKIDTLTEEIANKEAEIEATELELQEAIEVQTNQYEAMKKRIKFMYEQGNTLYLELLVESGSFGDMLNKAEYIELLSSYDRQKLDEYITQTQLVELTKEALEEEKVTLDEAKEAVEIEQSNMQALMDEKSSQLSSVNADIKDKEAAIKEYEAQIAAEDAAIKALEAEVAKDKAELNKIKYDGGMFAWPCPGYTRISDDYGMRLHPTLGIQKMHNGIDLAAPAGTAILAAYTGTVVAASYEASMGNYVMINHGDGLYTVYMHCSKLYVSQGQSVTKGQTIAAVGTTGRSTGNHLHFGVRLNGSYVSPWNYLSK
ncbi:MAG: peptidoglycan DD-metalloendopeptidase family protein [Butyrivibrio sp.]|nr:peptidoglycan DD-metalloendopeptidase family protein [Butyrivibrio sp.]